MVVGGFTNPFVSTGTEIGNPPGKARQSLVWVLHPAKKPVNCPMTRILVPWEAPGSGRNVYASEIVILSLSLLKVFLIFC